MLFDLTGKKALVTSATGGIGSAIVKHLHRQGAEVAIWGTNQEKLDALAEKLKDKVRSFRCNLIDHEAVKAFLYKVDDALFGVDILDANAGVTRDSLVLRMKDNDWQEVLDINLNSTFYLNRAAFRKMIKRRFGRIIIISSVVAVSGNLGQVNYCASKAGIIGMSKVFASETAARGITLNCIVPGFIKTHMTNI